MDSHFHYEYLLLKLMCFQKCIYIIFVNMKDTLPCELLSYLDSKFKIVIITTYIFLEGNIYV